MKKYSLLASLFLILSFSNLARAIVINEIMQNPSAVFDSDGEWFELYNPSSTSIDINGWTISDNDFDSHVIDNGTSLIIPAGGFLVLGNNTDTSTNGGVNVSYNYGSSFFLANAADELILQDTGLNEIDRVEWDDGATFPDPTGASMLLIDPALDNNIGSNWLTSIVSYGAGDLGTPGAENSYDIAAPGDVVINEIMQNPSVVFDSEGEWFEVHNPTSSPIDINGWTIKDEDFDVHVIDNGGPLIIPPGGYLVLGRNSDSSENGGVTVDYQYGELFLANGADELELLDILLQPVDFVGWDGGPLFPDPTGASMALLDPQLDNSIGSNWTESTTPFGDGDYGTPRSSNFRQVPEPTSLALAGLGLAAMRYRRHRLNIAA
jgi:hypothetical protein